MVHKSFCAFTINNRPLTISFQLDELNESYDKELKSALQQAEDYTVKYEEVGSTDQTVLWSVSTVQMFAPCSLS